VYDCKIEVVVSDNNSCARYSSEFWLDKARNALTGNDTQAPLRQDTEIERISVSLMAHFRLVFKLTVS